MANETEQYEIRETARRRWVELQKQIARHGADSDPADLIEADDIARRWGFRLDPTTIPPDLRGRGEVRAIDLDWLRLLVASALKIAAAGETRALDDMQQRRSRQMLNNIVFGLIILLQFIILAELGSLAGRVGGW